MLQARDTGPQVIPCLVPTVGHCRWCRELWALSSCRWSGFTWEGRSRLLQAKQRRGDVMATMIHLIRRRRMPACRHGYPRYQVLYPGHTRGCGSRAWDAPASAPALGAPPCRNPQIRQTDGSRALPINPFLAAERPIGTGPPPWLRDFLITPARASSGARLFRYQPLPTSPFDT